MHSAEAAGWNEMPLVEIVVQRLQPQITTAHSFPQAVEFRAKPQNLPFAAEF